MKKKSLKLALHRETLRTLADPKLRGIRGGIVTGNPCTGTCTCSCTQDDPFKTEGTACCQ